MVMWSKQSESKPFCSQRCRLIDLGQWASEQHRIPCAVRECGSIPEEVLLGCAPQDVTPEHETGDAAEHEDTPANEPNENLH